MPWDSSKNTNCGRDTAGRIRYKSATAVETTAVLLDELGRVFLFGHQVDNLFNIEHDEGSSNVHTPTLWDEGPWASVDSSEKALFLQKEDGSLWGAGQPYPRSVPFGMHTVDHGFYSDIIPLHVGKTFKKGFSPGWYHCLGISDADGMCYFWGTMFDLVSWSADNSHIHADKWPEADIIEVNAFGSAVIRSIINPAIVPGINEPCKSVSCSYMTSAIVTESDKVYIWGEFYGEEFLSPVHIPFTLPPGVSIEKVVCNWEGVIILLTNGDTYALGDLWYWSGEAYIEMLTGGTSWWMDDYTQFHPTSLTLQGRKIKFLRSKDWNATYAIDIFDNLWTAGDHPFGGGRLTNAWTGLTGGNCYFSSGHGVGFHIAGAEAEGVNKYSYAEPNGYYYFQLAIDIHGYLYIWGRNWGGLGVGEVHFNTIFCTPVKTAPAINEYGDFVGPNLEIPAATTPSLIVIPSQPQFKRGPTHEPCGHWHKHIDIEVGGLETWWNCWQTAMGVTEDGRIIMGVGGMRFPYDVMLVEYSSRYSTWMPFHSTTMVRSGSYPGEMAVHGLMKAFYNSRYDVQGTNSFDSSFTNHCMGVWTHFGEVNRFDIGQTKYYHDWPGSIPEDGRGRIGVHESGMVALAMRRSGEVQVFVSTDNGETFSLKRGISTQSQYHDYKLRVDYFGRIWLALLRDDNNWFIHTSDDNGESWEVLSGSSIAGAKQIGFWVHDSILCMLLFEPDGVKRLQMSEDGGTTWLYPGSDTYQASQLIVNTAWALSQMTSANAFFSPEIREEAMEVVPTPITPQTRYGSLSGNKAGILAYSHYDLRNPLNPTGLVFLQSWDKGASWHIRPTPFSWLDGDIVQERCDPLWGLQQKKNKIKTAPSWKRIYKK